MFRRNTLSLALIGAGLLSALASPAHAQRVDDEPGLDTLVAMVGGAMPPVIGNDNAELVGNLLGVELGIPISRSFDFAKAKSAVFGRTAPNLQPDCGRTTTPSGDPDQGECTAFVGDEKSQDAFRSLSFSKNLGVGNIRFLSRPRVTDLSAGDLKPVGMTNADAYDKGVKFLNQAFGLPTNELPPPPNADRLPVHDLSIGFDKASKLSPVAIQKVVYLRRGLKLPKALVDPTTKREMTHVPGPGIAKVAFAADGSVISATISRWQELRRGNHIDPKNAKSRDALVQEIARDLLANGGGHIETLKILIGLSTESRGSFGLLLPAVQVHVSPAGPGDTQPPGPTTGAYVREYALVDFKEATLER